MIRDKFVFRFVHYRRIKIMLTYLIKNHAIKNALVDIPNDRSSHAMSPPHSGTLPLLWPSSPCIGYLLGSGRLNLIFFLL